MSASRLEDCALFLMVFFLYNETSAEALMKRKYPVPKSSDSLLKLSNFIYSAFLIASKKQSFKEIQ